jgi:hypothetical protein
MAPDRKSALPEPHQIVRRAEVRGDRIAAVCDGLERRRTRAPRPVQARAAAREPLFAM